MPLRALRLFHFPSTSEPALTSALSFASTLQLAAGQAWTRRVMAHALIKSVRRRGVQTGARSQQADNSTERENESPCGSSSSSSSAVNLRNTSKANTKPLGSAEISSSRVKSTKLRTEASQLSPTYNWRDALQTTSHAKRPSPLLNPGTSTESHNVTHFDPELNHYEPTAADTCPPDDDAVDLFDEIPPETRAALLTTVSDELPAPGLLHLIPPSSRNSLFRNLLYLINVRKPPANLTTLVDYHARYPNWQSTKSFNFLISLSLRHRQHGVTHLLFRSLAHNFMPRNLEAHSLFIRWLIQRDLWDDAWNYVQQLRQRKLFPPDEHGHQDIPMPIWLEFARVPKKRWKSARDVDESDIDGTYDLAFLQERYRFLQSIRPKQLPPLSATAPSAISCLVRLMVRCGEQKAAMALTETYFKALPRPLSLSKADGCLKIIHVHLNSCQRKPGLTRFHESRGKLDALLHHHPSLRPNGDTVCLMLKTLKRTTRCGTVAEKYLEKYFKKNWGPDLVTRRVLRVMSHLALKENRFDLTKKYRNDEYHSRLRRQQRLHEVAHTHRLERVPASRLRRLPFRSLYPGNGKEAFLWNRLRSRIQRQIKRRQTKKTSS